MLPRRSRAAFPAQRKEVRHLLQYKFSRHVPAMKWFFLNKWLWILEGNGNSDILISLIIQEDLGERDRNIASHRKPVAACTVHLKYCRCIIRLLCRCQAAEGHFYGLCVEVFRQRNITSRNEKYMSEFKKKIIMHQDLMFLNTYHVSFCGGLFEICCCAYRKAIFYSLLDWGWGLSFEIISRVSRNGYKSCRSLFYRKKGYCHYFSIDFGGFVGVFLVVGLVWVGFFMRKLLWKSTSNLRRSELNNLVLKSVNNVVNVTLSRQSPN